MANPFIAEIRIFGFNFPPTGWAFCDGQLMSISQNTALFSLLGTTYGGDGRVTFGLPNLQGSAPLNFNFDGSNGLSPRSMGEVGGEPYVTLLQSEMPAHTHSLNATTSPADVSSPTATTALARSTGASVYAPGASTPTPLNPTVLAPTGGSQPHNNLMPYLTLNFCIALQGVYPPRP